MQYGWHEPAPAKDPDVLRGSLERHEDDLPQTPKRRAD